MRTRSASIGSRCIVSPRWRRAEAAMQVAAAQRRTGRRIVGDQLRQLGVARRRRTQVGRSARPAHPTARPCGSSRVPSTTGRPSPTTDASATTPRKQASAARRAVGARRRVGRHRRDLAEQVGELLDRAHEVAAGEVLLGDDLGEALPCHPGVGDGEERRLGRTVDGEPVLLLEERKVDREPLDRARSGRGRRGSGTTAAADRQATDARRRTSTRGRPGSARRRRRAARRASPR